METQFIQNKLNRYLHGGATPAEVKQVEAWLSSMPASHLHLSGKDEDDLKKVILYGVQCYTAYPLLFPRKKEYWKKIKPVLINLGYGLAAILLVYLMAFYNW